MRIQTCVSDFVVSIRSKRGRVLFPLAALRRTAVSAEREVGQQGWIAALEIAAGAVEMSQEREVSV